MVSNSSDTVGEGGDIRVSLGRGVIPTTFATVLSAVDAKRVPPDQYCQVLIYCKASDGRPIN